MWVGVRYFGIEIELASEMSSVPLNQLLSEFRFR